MRIFSMIRMGAGIACLALSTAAFAGGPDLAKYPLRVHIFRYRVQPRNTHDFKRQSDMAEYVNGMGQAVLFEGGEPRGFQYRYSCTVPMQASGRYATYPARWKKKDKTLEILLPQEGKAENLDSCDLQTEIRTGLVYYWKNGEVAEEPAEVLKEWMVKHKFNPESNDEEPVLSPSEAAPTGGAGDSQIAEPE
jgi:hypothetical protein